MTSVSRLLTSAISLLIDVTSSLRSETRLRTRET